MMAISKEFNTECKQCHVGSKGLSSFGALSSIMWEYSIDHQKECTDCHLPSKLDQLPFKNLTTEGQQTKKRMHQTFDVYLTKAQFSPQLHQKIIQYWTQTAAVKSTQKSD